MIAVYRESPRTCLFPVGRPECARLLERMLQALGLEDASLELILTDDAAIAELNLNHMGVPGPTNILSFPMQDQDGSMVLDTFALSMEQDPDSECSGDGSGDYLYPDDPDPDDPEMDEQGVDAQDAQDVHAPEAEEMMLGSLVLSVETLVREAFLYHQDPHEHFLTLLAHGLVHLAGYEHGPDMDQQVTLAVAAAGASVHTGLHSS